MFYLPQWGLNKVANVKSNKITMQEGMLKMNTVTFLKETFYIGADLGIFFLFAWHLGESEGKPLLYEKVQIHLRKILLLQKHASGKRK